MLCVSCPLNDGPLLGVLGRGVLGGSVDSRRSCCARHAGRRKGAIEALVRAVLRNPLPWGILPASRDMALDVVRPIEVEGGSVKGRGSSAHARSLSINSFLCQVVGNYGGG